VEESAKSVEKAISVGTSNAALTAISCSVAEMRVVKMAYPVEKKSKLKHLKCLNFQNLKILSNFLEISNVKHNKIMIIWLVK